MLNGAMDNNMQPSNNVDNNDDDDFGNFEDATPETNSSNIMPSMVPSIPANDAFGAFSENTVPTATVAPQPTTGMASPIEVDDDFGDFEDAPEKTALSMPERSVAVAAPFGSFGSAQQPAGDTKNKDNENDDDDDDNDDFGDFENAEHDEPEIAAASDTGAAFGGFESSAPMAIERTLSSDVDFDDPFAGLPVPSDAQEATAATTPDATMTMTMNVGNNDVFGMETVSDLSKSMPTPNMSLEIPNVDVANNELMDKNELTSEDRVANDDDNDPFASIAPASSAPPVMLPTLNGDSNDATASMMATEQPMNMISSLMMQNGDANAPTMNFKMDGNAAGLGLEAQSMNRPADEAYPKSSGDDDADDNDDFGGFDSAPAPPTAQTANNGHGPSTIESVIATTTAEASESDDFGDFQATEQSAATMATIPMPAPMQPISNFTDLPSPSQFGVSTISGGGGIDAFGAADAISDMMGPAAIPLDNRQQTQGSGDLMSAAFTDLPSKEQPQDDVDFGNFDAVGASQGPPPLQDVFGNGQRDERNAAANLFGDRDGVHATQTGDNNDEFGNFSDAMAPPVGPTIVTIPPSSGEGGISTINVQNSEVDDFGDFGRATDAQDENADDDGGFGAFEDAPKHTPEQLPKGDILDGSKVDDVEDDDGFGNFEDAVVSPTMVSLPPQHLGGSTGAGEASLDDFGDFEGTASPSISLPENAVVSPSNMDTTKPVESNGMTNSGANSSGEQETAFGAFGNAEDVPSQLVPSLLGAERKSSNIEDSFDDPFAGLPTAPSSQGEEQQQDDDGDDDANASGDQAANDTVGAGFNMAGADTAENVIQSDLPSDDNIPVEAPEPLSNDPSNFVAEPNQAAETSNDGFSFFDSLAPPPAALDPIMSFTATPEVKSDSVPLESEIPSAAAITSTTHVDLMDAFSGIPNADMPAETAGNEEGNDDDDDFGDFVEISGQEVADTTDQEASGDDNNDDDFGDFDDAGKGSEIGLQATTNINGSLLDNNSNNNDGVSSGNDAQHQTPTEPNTPIEPDAADSTNDLFPVPSSVPPPQASATIDFASQASINMSSGQEEAKDLFGAFDSISNDVGGADSGGFDAFDAISPPEPTSVAQITPLDGEDDGGDGDGFGDFASPTADTSPWQDDPANEVAPAVAETPPSTADMEFGDFGDATTDPASSESVGPEVPSASDDLFGNFGGSGIPVDPQVQVPPDDNGGKNDDSFGDFGGFESVPAQEQSNENVRDDPETTTPTATVDFFGAFEQGEANNSMPQHRQASEATAVRTAAEPSPRDDLFSDGGVDTNSPDALNPTVPHDAPEEVTPQENDNADDDKFGNFGDAVASMAPVKEGAQPTSHSQPTENVEAVKFDDGEDNEDLDGDNDDDFGTVSNANEPSVTKVENVAGSEHAHDNPFGSFDGAAQATTSTSEPQTDDADDDFGDFGDFSSGGMQTSERNDTSADEDAENIRVANEAAPRTVADPQKATDGDHHADNDNNNDDDFGNFDSAADLVNDDRQGATDATQQANPEAPANDGEDDDFGDFGAFSSNDAKMVPADGETEDISKVEAPSGTPQSHEIRDGGDDGDDDDDDDDDDFGDFGDFTSNVPSTTQQNDAANADDDFGNFDEATSTAPQSSITTDDDFGDFGDFDQAKVDAGSSGDFGDFGDAGDSNIVAAEVPNTDAKEGGNNDDDDDFGAFDSVETSNATSNNDDFGNFDSVKSTAPPSAAAAPSSTPQPLTSQHASPTAHTSSYSMNGDSTYAQLTSTLAHVVSTASREDDIPGGSDEEEKPTTDLSSFLLSSVSTGGQEGTNQAGETVISVGAIMEELHTSRTLHGGKSVANKTVASYAHLSSTMVTTT